MPGNKSLVIPLNSGISWERNFGSLTSFMDLRSWKLRHADKITQSKTANQMTNSSNLQWGDAECLENAFISAQIPVCPHSHQDTWAWGFLRPRVQLWPPSCRNHNGTVRRAAQNRACRSSRSLLTVVWHWGSHMSTERSLQSVRSWGPSWPLFGTAPAQRNERKRC